VLKYDGVDDTVFASPLTADTEALILIVDATIDTSTTGTVDMLGLKLDVSTLDIVCDGGFVTNVPKVWFDNIVVAIGVDARDELVSLGGMTGRSVNTKESLLLVLEYDGVNDTLVASALTVDVVVLIFRNDATDGVVMLGFMLGVKNVSGYDGGIVTGVRNVWFDNGVVAIRVYSKDEVVSLGEMTGKSVNIKEALYALVNNGVEGTVCASPVIADTEALILTVDA